MQNKITCRTKDTVEMMAGNACQRQTVKAEENGITDIVFFEETGITNIIFLWQFWYCTHAISIGSLETNTFQSQRWKHTTIQKTQAIWEARVSSAPWQP